MLCPNCGFNCPSDARFCGMCGTRLEWVYQVYNFTNKEFSLEGERRIATALVTDFSGSTVLLEKIGTEAWVTLMNRILQLLETEIYRFGGQVHQFRGDGLVAFFGASAAHEDDPERAVLAGLSM